MGVALAVLIWVIAIATTLLFAGKHWWFPESISEHGQDLDGQFALTIGVIGVAFILAQLALGYFVLRYRARGSERASYWHDNPKLEVAWTVVTAIVFVGLSVLSQRIWAKVHLTEPSADAVPIEVTGQQFVWNIRYPGPDGKFGRTKPELINDVDNPVGLDLTDPAARDDIVTVNRMAIPVNRDIRLILRSKDVIHSFWVPWLRLKQDTVPGLAITIHFKATKIGEYEIACAELCGLGHHRMRGFLSVQSESDFQRWLQQRASQ
ncbi:MAG TPA: cytochrome c oxidase subunit II [Blastocatellia bacterium]|nr:cytochrome c oxidase subunit II [Blastocatellia bacterium]